MGAPKTDPYAPGPVARETPTLVRRATLAFLALAAATVGGRLALAALFEKDTIFYTSIALCFVLLPGSLIAAYLCSRRLASGAGLRILQTLGLGIVIYIAGVAIVFVGCSWLTAVDSKKAAGDINTKSEVAELATKLNQYKLRFGDYPTNEHGLDALVKKPHTPPIPPDWEAELSTVPLDPWGRRYHYLCPGEHNHETFDVWSDGPDERSGTDDDIGNWWTER